MLKVVFLLFIGVPLLELYVLIEVGAGIGGLPTIALCLLTAAIGGLLVRFQGLQTLFNAQKQLASGQIPADAGIHGIMIAAAGIMLFLPGFVSDGVGFLLLMPMVRRLAIKMVFGTMQAKRRAANDTIIDAEIVESDPHHLP